jgi:uncharacterized protein with FMN-binding domain
MTNKANKKVANSLVAMSSAAVLAVYAAGYVRTRAAADRFAQLEDAGRARPKPDIAGGGSAKLQRDITENHEVRLEPDTTADPEVRLKPDTTNSRPAAVQLQPDRQAAGDSPKSTASAAAAATADVPAPAEPLAPPKIEEPKAAELTAPVVAAEPPKSEYKDGTYLGWGHCRHGDIQAQVVISGGRIASATIAQCLTRYSCNVIDKLPPQVAQRQSPDVDTISGATQSGDAFYYAVLDALYLAK